MSGKTRTPVLLETPETPVGLALKARSEGVRKAFGSPRKLKKVVGVGSLAKILEISYGQLAELLAPYIGGQVYTRQTMCIWSSVERRSKFPRGWFKKYWMPRAVEAAFKRMIRDIVAVASRGRMRARVSGTHRWRVEVVRVGGK